MKFNSHYEEGDGIYIPYHDSNKFFHFTWEEGDSWDDMFKRNEWGMHDSFRDFVEFHYAPYEFEDYVFPADVQVYSCNDCYLIAKNSMPELSDLIAVPKNDWAYIDFFKQYCLPFARLKNE